MRGQERKREGDVEKRDAEVRQRVPVSGPRDVLKIYGEDPNYVYRFVNDVNNRIARFQRGGWDIVTDDLEVGAPRVGVPESEGTPVKVSVGSGVQAYLMRIRREWYEEDQAAKQRAIDDTEAAMRAESNKDGMYGKISTEYR